VVEDLGPPPTTPGGTVNAPITATIPAGQLLFIEVDVGTQAQTRFYMGANNDGEMGFGYILAPTCNVGGAPINVPTNISTVSPTNPAVHLLFTVTGTY
jgi:hypothetical protein